MADFMQIKDVVPSNRMVLVDTVTGTILGVHEGLVLTYLPHNVSVDDDNEIVERARLTGMPLYVDLDDA